MSRSLFLALLGLTIIFGCLNAPADVSALGESGESIATDASETVAPPDAQTPSAESSSEGPADDGFESPDASAGRTPPETLSPESAGEPSTDSPSDTSGALTPSTGGSSLNPDSSDRSSTPSEGRPRLPALSENEALVTVKEGEAPPPANPITEATLALLRQLETRHASVVTVRGTFDQLKVSEIFLEEIRSKGTFWYQKPDLFRCDYQPPDEMTNLILRDSIYMYVPDIQQCEVYRFTSDQERDQQLHSMVLGFGFRTEDLQREYAIESSEDAGALRDELKSAGLDPARKALLHLTPLAEFADTSPFTTLKLWIDKGNLLPEKVWFDDYNGDKTTIEIRTIDLNIAVEPSLFKPTFPPGTEYIDKTAS